VQLLDAFDLVEGAVEIRLAYTTRALLPAKVRAFVEHATEFFAQPADARHPEQAGS